MLIHQQPLVSVIIPAYNHELYIRDTLKSIIRQSYEHIELIIIDDGSKDDTLKVIGSMRSICEQRFLRVHVETQENQGTCTTLNKLISLAKGEYVLLIASDDELLPNAVASLVEKMEQTPDAGLVTGRNVIMDGEGKPCFWDAVRNNVYDSTKATYLSFSDFLDATTYPTTHPKWGTYEALLKGNHVPNGYLIRKSILDSVPRFTKEAPLEDWWLMLQIAKVSRIVSIDEDTFRYRWHSANTIKQTEKMNLYARMTMACERKLLLQLSDKKWIHLYKRTILKNKLLKFLYQKKITSKGRTIVKILKLPVYVSRKK